MRVTLWIASRSAAWSRRWRKHRRRPGRPIPTGGRRRPDLANPETRSTVGREARSYPRSWSIYLKRSKEAKPPGWPKAPRQKPTEAAQTIPRPLRGGLRRNTDPAPKPSAPTGTPAPLQLRVTTPSTWPGKPLLSGIRREVRSEVKPLVPHPPGWSRS